MAALLARSPLFAELSNPALARLAGVSVERQLARAQTLFFQNDAADAAYVLYSGSIAILLTTTDGRELVINEMCAGDCFGEVALLTDSSRSTSAVAQEACRVLVIPRKEFLAAITSEPPLMRHMIYLLAQRLRDGTQRERALAFLDAPTRLARILIELDRAASAKGYVTISQEDLAQRIGATRQTTAKVLGQWRRKGWIVTGRGRIVVLNRAAVSAAAGDD